jgi:hypothetical protein
MEKPRGRDLVPRRFTISAEMTTRNSLQEGQDSPSKQKKPGGQRPPGGHSNPIISLNALDRENRCQISADFHCCEHPEGASLGKGGNARIVIAELLAQDLPRVLTKQRRRDGVDDRRQAKVER